MLVTSCSNKRHCVEKFQHFVFMIYFQKCYKTNALNRTSYPVFQLHNYFIFEAIERISTKLYIRLYWEISTKFYFKTY
jgi:hypothetical protein